MANTSILAAFERMWSYVVIALNGKSDVSHNHDDMYYTEAETDNKFTLINSSIETSLQEAKTYVDEAVAQKTQIQIITWEADD